MRRATRISLRLWLLLAMLVGTAGCLGGPAPRDHVYRLQVEAPGSARNAAAFPGTLEVEMAILCTNRDIVRFFVQPVWEVDVGVNHQRLLREAHRLGTKIDFRSWLFLGLLAPN